MYGRPWLIGAALLAPWLSARALTVDYPDGYVEVDPQHKARMHLSLTGSDVTGTLDSEAIVQSNVRLPGARMRLKGTLTGNWEKGGSISGQCTGQILWPDGTEDRAGQFWISVAPDGVLFRSTKFYYNKYVFRAAGVDYTATGAPSTPTNQPGGKVRGPVQTSLILLFDCSSSMENKSDKFTRFQKTAKNSLSTLGPNCEVALITFGGCNNITLVRDFTAMTDEARADFGQAIDSLTTASDTPLAQALSFAGDHMRSFARGRTRQIMLLSDGIETCSGDPVKAAGGLNVKIIGGKKITGKPPPKEPPDPDEIKEILVQPDRITMAPGSDNNVPTVVAVLGATADQQELPADEVTWRCQSPLLAVDSGKVRLSDKAKPGDTLELVAVLKRQRDELTAKCLVVVKEVVRRGVVRVTVDLNFHPPLGQDHSQDPAPLRVVVELRRGNARYMQQAAAGGGPVIFQDVEPGTYNVWIGAIELPSLPAGYAPKEQPPCYGDLWLRIPEMKWSDAANARVECWTNGTRVSFKLRNDQDADNGYLFGTVTFQGQPARGVEVSVAKTGSQKTAITDEDGTYRMKVNELESGDYWVRAQKIVIPRWTDPEDLLDAASYRDNRAVMVTVPVGLGGQRIDIECVKRGGASIKDQIPEIENGPRPTEDAP